MLFLFFYCLQLFLLAVRTLISDGLLVLFLLEYPHWLMILLNTLLIHPNTSKDLKYRLAALGWVQFLLLIIILVEICYELSITYDYFTSRFKPVGLTNFWSLMRTNFLLILMFSPAILNFVSMRLVTEEIKERKE